MILPIFLSLALLAASMPAPVFGAAYSDDAGSFVVEAYTDGAWQFAARESFPGRPYPDRYTAKVITLPEPANRIRIINSGDTQAAHLDAVFLEGAAPLSVKNQSDDSIPPLKKFESADYDVVDARNRTLEFSWDKKGSRLEITGVAEDFKGVPYRWPESGYLSYKIGDKKIYTYDAIPFSSHPYATRFAYLSADNNNLYVKLDWTSDNTLDEDGDWAEIGIVSPGGLKTFLISNDETGWGTSAYEYTDKVSWQHKTYSFVIPLNETGAEYGNTVEFQIRYYGTDSGEGRGGPRGRGRDRDEDDDPQLPTVKLYPPSQVIGDYLSSVSWNWLLKWQPNLTLDGTPVAFYYTQSPVSPSSPNLASFTSKIYSLDITKNSNVAAAGCLRPGVYLLWNQTNAYDGSIVLCDSLLAGNIRSDVNNTELIKFTPSAWTSSYLPYLRIYSTLALQTYKAEHYPIATEIQPTVEVKYKNPATVRVTVKSSGFVEDFNMVFKRGGYVVGVMDGDHSGVRGYCPSRYISFQQCVNNLESGVNYGPYYDSRWGDVCINVEAARSRGDDEENDAVACAGLLYKEGKTYLIQWVTGWSGSYVENSLYRFAGLIVTDEDGRYTYIDNSVDPSILNPDPGEAAVIREMTPESVPFAQVSIERPLNTDIIWKNGPLCIEQYGSKGCAAWAIAANGQVGNGSLSWSTAGSGGFFKGFFSFLVSAAPIIGFVLGLGFVLDLVSILGLADIIAAPDLAAVVFNELVTVEGLSISGITAVAPLFIGSLTIPLVAGPGTFGTVENPGDGLNWSWSPGFSVGNLPEQENPECSDGIDNDGDGLIDYPADTGCTSSEDIDEWNPPPPPAPVVSIVPGGASIVSRETVQLRAWYDPDGPGNPKKATEVTAFANWISDNPAAATVDNAANKGLVTGKGSGTANVAGTYEGISGAASVNVTVPFLQRIREILPRF